MKLHQFVFFGLVGFLGLAGVASAAPITYDVTVNTSSISGTNGSLDFNFNPGAIDSQPADLQILGFSTNGTLVPGSCPCGTGDVSGQLAGTLTFDNGTGFNDYFEDFTFGNTLAFAVRLFGRALSAPDGISSSGSSFAFSMFSDAAGTIPTLTTDSTFGTAFTVGVSLDGTTTVVDSSRQTSITPVPEPATLLLVGGGMVGMLRRHRRARNDRR